MIEPTMMIKTIIRTPEDMVFVFSADGWQISQYQGWYQEVNELVLRNTGTGTIFKHWPVTSAEPEIVPWDHW